MSKRIWQHPEVPADETTVSWRGVGQLEDTPGFRTWLEREFPQGVAEMADDDDAQTSFRNQLEELRTELRRRCCVDPSTHRNHDGFVVRPEKADLRCLVVAQDLRRRCGAT